MKLELKRELLKYIAIILMLIDHIAKVFMDKNTIEYTFINSLSHFTFITMCFLLVEGYYYTKSKTAYAKRLFIFGIISQIPYQLALNEGKVFSLSALNIFFTLLLCFLIVWVLDAINNIPLKLICVLALSIVCLFCDWTIYAPIFTLAFYFAKGSKFKQLIAFILIMLIYGLSNTSGYFFQMPLPTTLFYFGINISGIVLSVICILGLYKGKQFSTHKQFNKWFFYIFYPAHLLVIGLVALS